MALSDKDIDETMAADWAAIQDKYRPDETDAPESETTAPEAETTTAAATDRGEGSETIPVTREADGKFKAREDKGKPAKVDKAALQVDKAATTAAKGVVETSAAPTEQAAGDQPQARDINRAPSTWKPAARAEWDKLSPAIRAEIHRREADFQNGQSQLIPDATLGREMRAAIEPYRMLIETTGATPQRAVGDMLRQAATMRTGNEQQKYQTIAQIANFYGIDLRRFAPRAAPPGQQPTPQPQQFQDPRVDQLLAHQRQVEQQRAQEDQRNTESVVTRWMNEADAQGNPKREYLGDVINEMSALVPQIRQADPTMTHAQALDAAYERAIWAHPEVRALLVQKQQTDLDAQRRSDNQVRVRDARRAGSVNVPRRASSPSPAKPGSLEETIASTARELGLIT